jgi:hypothetical protein
LFPGGNRTTLFEIGKTIAIMAWALLGISVAAAFTTGTLFQRVEMLERRLERMDSGPSVAELERRLHSLELGMEAQNTRLTSINLQLAQIAARLGVETAQHVEH